MNLSSRVESYLNKLGTFGFLIFLFFAWLGNAVACIGLMLMCIAFLAQFRRHWETIKYDRPTISSDTYCLVHNRIPRVEIIPSQFDV